MRLVNIERPLIELEGADAAGIDDLDRDRLRRIENPADVVVDSLLRLAGREHAQQEVIAAEHRVSALVDDRRIAHLEVRLARVDRQHRRLKASRVTHLGIAIACCQRARCGVAAARAGQFATRINAAAMILGQQQAGEIELPSADVRVKVDRAGHHHSSAHVDLSHGAVIGRRRDDSTVAHIKIPDFTMHAVRRIVDPTTAELRHHGLQALKNGANRLRHGWQSSFRAVVERAW